MKKRLFTMSLVIMFIFTTIAPSVFAASNSYSFTMKHRVVDGSASGKYMKLKKGKATISGSHYQSEERYGAVGPNEVHYTLYNKTSGNSFGTITSTAPTNGNSQSYSGTFSGLGGGTKYYLLIYKVYEDGRTVKGSGTVSN